MYIFSHDLTNFVSYARDYLPTVDMGFSGVHSIHKVNELQNKLETSFQRLIWGFRGVNFEYYIFRSI